MSAEMSAALPVAILPPECPMPQSPSRVRRAAPALVLALCAACAGAPAFAQDPAPATEPPAAEKPVAETPAAADAVDATAKDEGSKIPLEEIRRYVGVFNTVKQAYVEPVDDRKLMQSAIRGLLQDLDPHSAYLVRSDAQAFDEDASGAYQGIGVEVQQQPDGPILVVSPIDGSPAAAAGVRAGDLIVAVDGKPLTADSIEANPLRGEVGSTVNLTIRRKAEKAPLQIAVKRDVIRVGSVRGRMLEPGYAYVRIGAFQADTATDFERNLDQLQAKAGGKGLRGLVLDLRSNPGGLLTSAVQIADDLLDKGDIVSTRGRDPVGDALFRATPGDRLGGAPMVVLVDAGSASAAEVLTAALRDNRRARVVGSRTFGKGSVQTVLPLDNGDAIKLTTARYYTPSGKSIQAHGIDPDVVLKPDGGAARPADYSEAGLSGHLRGDEESENAATGDVLDGDAPIQSALAVLKQQVATLPAPDRR